MKITGLKVLQLWSVERNIPSDNPAQQAGQGRSLRSLGLRGRCAPLGPLPLLLGPAIFTILKEYLYG
jgi:hypothetical protein